MTHDEENEAEIVRNLARELLSHQAASFSCATSLFGHRWQTTAQPARGWRRLFRRAKLVKRCARCSATPPRPVHTDGSLS